MEAIDAQRRLLKIAGILYGLTGILFKFRKLWKRTVTKP